MVQREVAARLHAAPGSRDYGVLSIFVQLHADVRPVLALPPGAFRPMPKVHSSVVHLSFRPPAVALPDESAFEAMVRTMFGQRRKMLLNALRPYAESRNQERRRRAGRGRHRSDAADPRRCNLQNWRGLRSFSRPADRELCYSLRVFAQSLMHRPSGAPGGHSDGGPQPLRAGSAHPGRLSCAPGPSTDVADLTLE